MRLTIIPIDGNVNKDGKVYLELDLSSCGIPADVHALQWGEYEPNKGHIEFKSPMAQNQEITELPVWASACLAKWEEAKAAEEAAKQAAEAAKQAAEAAKQTATNT